MILRGFSHAEASIVCLVTGSVATAEVVSRVTLESALNVLYVLQQDRVGRLFDYLSAYVKQERAELSRWEAMLPGMEPDEAVVHRHEIENKRSAIDLQDSIAQGFGKDTGITRSPQPWPKISDRFRLVDQEVDYRVLYAAMCSQTHNDAEDLLNTFILGATAHLHPEPVARALKLRQEAENRYFATLLVYRSIEYLFSCIERYGESYGIREISEVGAQAYQTMRDLTADSCRQEFAERAELGDLARSFQSSDRAAKRRPSLDRLKKRKRRR